MKITKSQLSLIIENFLNEQDWLGDEEEYFLPTKNDKIKTGFKNAINEVSDELLNSDYESQGLTNRLVNYIVKLLKNNIQLFINDEVLDQTTGVKAMVYHVDFSYDSDGNLDMSPDSIPDWLNIPSSMMQKFKSDSARNPIVVVNSANAIEKQIKDDLLHEIRHVKNGLIKSITRTAKTEPGAKLNLEVVKKVLRKDLVGKNENEVLEILTKEGRIESEKGGYGELIKRLNMYYQGAFSPKTDILGIEELSVRISALKNQPQAFNDYKSGKVEYDYYKKKYNTDIADIILFLDKNVSLESLDKIVKIKNTQKSVTA